MADLLIFGAGDIARLAHYYFTHDSPHRILAFAVDAAYRTSDRMLDLPVLDIEHAIREYPPDHANMFVALSYAKMNKIRETKYRYARELGYSLVSYVSSRCTWLSDQPPGDNCFILENNTVQPFVRIGNNVTLWSGNHIGHDAIIEDHCFLTSHVVVSGRVRIERNCFVGVNATIRNAITIARETLIGAGAVVMSDTQPRGVYLPKRAELFAKTSDQIEL